MSSVISIGRTVTDAALAGLARRPGRPATERNWELEELVLNTVDDAVAAGFWHTWATGVWQVCEGRVHRWRARRCVFAALDMVSRCWTATLVWAEETSTQVRVTFDQALGAQDLDELLTEGRLDLDIDDPDRAILLAVSDNGPATASHDTRAYMAMTAIARHHRRPHTPTDQAWIESFFSHINHEWPHLNDITDPALLDTEPARIRLDHNRRTTNNNPANTA